MEGKTTRRDAMTAGLAAGVGGLAMAAITAPEALATTSGRCFISGEESRSSSTYGLLSTPDQVQNIDVPTQGKLRISYLAGWKSDTANAQINAAIFIGSDQLLSPSTASGLTSVNEAIDISNANQYASVFSRATGMESAPLYLGGSGPATFSGFATTGVVVSPVEVFVAAGTYTVSVRFKTSAGSVSVKDRHLWVEAIAY